MQTKFDADRPRRYGCGARYRRYVVTAMALALVAGTLGLGPGAGGVETAAVPAPCEDPFPCGNEWPDELVESTFELEAVTEERVRMSDGVELHGWIYRPALSNGVRAPVVLWSSPYWGTINGSGDDKAMRDNSSEFEIVPIKLLVERGYAVALFSVRGTGRSDGCFSWLGPREQRDHYELIQWLASQSWSNGRIGMMGQSYDSGTVSEAAAMNPPALKAIVTAANTTDWYLVQHSPQGALLTLDPVFQATNYPVVSVVPPVRSGATFRPDEWLAAFGDRVCADAVEVLSSAFANYGFERNEEFYAARQFTKRLANTKAAALITHGFADCGLCWQEDVIWSALRKAPKRMIVGPWGHSYPNFGRSYDRDWNAELLRWFEYWLKGVGERSALGLGIVEYQDNNHVWRTTTSWPPVGRDEVLYLGPDGLAGSPALGSRSYQSSTLVPDGTSSRPTSLHAGTSALCPGLDALAAAYTSAPLPQPVTIAGNPFAYLKLSATQPGGIVSVALVDLPPDAGCLSGVSDHRVLSFGSADLRHHAGNFDDRAFPVETQHSVRVDMMNLAETVPAGHRLAVVVHGGQAYQFGYEPRFHPVVTIHGALDTSASQVVVPVVEGTVGGSAAKRMYPPRPFGPTNGGPS